MRRGITVCANVHWRLRPEEDGALRALEALLQQQGGTPHLGKYHRLPPGRAERLLPGLRCFRALARSLDPQGVFEPAALAVELSLD